ncbi:tyrosine-protein phosphatase [Virgibacillus sp. W0181]|uniref:tyrosine-protein phosphatase n=1 Tax=Virgibacillus sp. W0181 TaxID=3391581 RepID=UPI003F46C74E
MIDIHCHILPGVDDGAKTEEDSLAMAKAAVEQGIHTIIATPHHKNGSYENDRGQIEKHLTFLNDLLQSEQIPLTILGGQELRINGDILTDIENGEILPVNDTKYVLIEFPSSSVPHYAKQMLFDIQVAGLTPIIVHPERNKELLAQPEKLYHFVRNGALTQVTAASVIGKFGKHAQKLSHQLIEANLTHFIASDAHNTTSRTFHLNEAYQEVKDLYGLDTYYMLLENSHLLIDNMNVNRLEPEMPKKKKFLGLF